MPELAEVEYYRKQWQPAIGQTVTGVHINGGKRVFRGVETEALQGDLLGQSFTDSATHGKQMCFRFGDCHWLGIHLGMTGKTRILPPGESPEKHDHLVLQMSGDSSLAFSDPRMFGRILYSQTGKVPSWWAMLPPEILSDGFTPERVNFFLDRRSRAPIKAVLLMQETFPGIGNWMADEILWRARIHPAKPAGQIGAKKRQELYERICEVTRDALCVIGTDWGTPPDDWLFNHRWKDGGICPQTGLPLKREQIGGRTTCWSPKWQRR
jgi:formamidopyrimidine-DNA glycosylase